MWAMLVVAIEAAMASVVLYPLLVKARAPHDPSRTEVFILNVLSVVAASIFELFLDSHGRPPALAFVIAALEPVVLAGIMFARRGEHTVR